MFIDSVINHIYPINESSGQSEPVKSLGKYLDNIYNKGGSWQINNINPTISEVEQLYDIYRNLAHDHVAPDKITTISSNVMEILKALGFKVIPDGVGWKLSEAFITNRGIFFKAYHGYEIYKDPKGLYRCYDPAGNMIYYTDSEKDAIDRITKKSVKLK
jgi:hypothetical protein